VFGDTVAPLLDSCLKGYNATVIAYGQTGSGKTWTMGSGNNLHMQDEELGIIPRVITRLFDSIQRLSQGSQGGGDGGDSGVGGEEEGGRVEFLVRCEFLEIYGETINDLLDPVAGSTKEVSIRELENGDVAAIGCIQEQVGNAEDLLNCLEKGSLNRTTGSTMMNAQSSRSHAIFTVFIEQRRLGSPDDAVPATSTAAGAEGTGTGAGAGGDDATTVAAAAAAVAAEAAGGGMEFHCAKFHFVDLAGSERAKRTQAVGQRMKEGIDINKGLLALGNVISSLGDTQRRRRNAHVPCVGRVTKDEKERERERERDCVR
jgi:kinesin family protein 4/21/27